MALEYSVPELLGIHAQHSIGEGVGVGEHIGLSKRLVSLETVKDLEELILDEINEDEIDGCVEGDVGRIGAYETGVGEERQSGLWNVVTDSRAGLFQECASGSVDIEL